MRRRGLAVSPAASSTAWPSAKAAAYSGAIPGARRRNWGRETVIVMGRILRSPVKAKAGGGGGDKSGSAERRAGGRSA